MKYIMLVLVIISLASCSKSGRRQRNESSMKIAKIVLTGEKFYIISPLYSKGDTIMVQYNETRWEVIKNWNNAQEYSKAVIQ